jgi:Protein of unknown function (DUF2934)
MARAKTPRIVTSKKNGNQVQATPESKKILVPINLEDEVRRRAYEIFEQRNGAWGSEAEDWFQAEREVRSRYEQTA